MTRKRSFVYFAVIIAMGCIVETMLSSSGPAVCEVCLLNRSAVAADETKNQNKAIIEGRVIYEADKKRRWRFGRYYIRDRKKGHLAEAVVALRSAGLKDFPAPTKSSTWTMNQKDVRFVPETLAVRVGDRVRFTNSDPQVHNINSQSPLARFDVTVGGGKESEHTFDRAGGTRRPVVLGCKLHSAMQAWVFVFGHPFFKLTEADGSFRFENVPPGKYRLEMVHPAGGLRWTRTITIAAGTQQQDIHVSPDHKLKP